MAKRRKKRKPASKRRQYYTKKRGGYARRKPMGLLGKAGIVMAGGVPLAMSSVHAANEVWVMSKLGTFTPLSLVGFGLATWVNELAHGFVGWKPFPEWNVRYKTGATMSHAINTGAPATAYGQVAIVGGLMVAIDKAIGMMTKKSTKKIAGVQLVSG